MKEMSISRKRARELVSAYGQSLEEQIVGRGSSLVCQDEKLWKQVEGLLRDGDAQETHRLGLDPLRVMEESLEAGAAAAAAAGAGRVSARAGLQGLAKAFEVVEQAALNLYLGPWREEYKVVKMYSGMFTHYIKPVLSLSQIEKVFGLLGYQPGSPRREQLRLQQPGVGPACLDDLLRLSCAFFLARCECRLLLTALGKHAGEVQWELSMVRERQKGNSLQVALEITEKTLEVNQPLTEQFDREVEVDIYTDEPPNGGQRGMVANDDGSPRSLSWVAPGDESLPAVKTHSNGVASLSTREDVCVSTYRCQLIKTSPLQSDTSRSSSAGGKRSKCPREESTFDKADPEFDDNATVRIEDPRAVSPQGGGLRASGASASPTLTSSTTAMSSLGLCDKYSPESVVPSRDPITYHDCCDLAHLDPRVFCSSCRVFHSSPCRNIDRCQSQHPIKWLGVCSCGRACSRNPLVLCRYCGNEYCTDCWYRSPVECSCGQTFDLSSSV